MSRVLCSFCGKSEEKVQHLVAGPRGVAICNECVRVCVQVQQVGFGGEGDLLLTSVGELVTNDRFVEGLTGRILDAAIAIRGGVIRWAGPELALPNRYRDLPTIDCEGRAVIPGLVDADTRALFGGEQGGAFERFHADKREFERTATELTQAATKATPDNRLESELTTRFEKMIEHGTTSIVAGSHFGTTSNDQLRLIELAIKLDGALPIDIITCDRYSLSHGTLLNTDYTELGPELDDEALAHLRSQGRSIRYRPDGARVNTEMLTKHRISGIVLDDELLDAAVLKYLASADGYAVVAPTVSENPTAREAWEHGVLVALATSCDPISRYSESMQASIALAVRSWGLSIDQAIWSATRGSALVVDAKEKGWVGRGAVADLVILDAPSASHLAYRVGTNLAWKTIKNGHVASAAPRTGT